MSTRLRRTAGRSASFDAPQAGAVPGPRARCLRCLLGGAAALAFAGMPMAPAAATVDVPVPTEITTEPAVLIETPVVPPGPR